MLLSSQHFGIKGHVPQLVALRGKRACSLTRNTLGKGVCWSSGIRTMKIDKKINYSHKLAQTKQQVGQCVARALLVHGRSTNKHGLIRLIIAHTWGKWESRNAQSCDFHDFCDFEAHNFVCTPSIEVRSEAKLQPLSRFFQGYVAHHLHTKKLGKLGKFLTFSGRESNYQFDSQPFV